MAERRSSHLVDHLGRGLNSTDPTILLPNGVGQVADNVWLARDTLKNPPGSLRKTKNRLNEEAILCNGKTHVLRSDVSATGATHSLRYASNAATLEVVTKSTSLKNVQTVLAKAQGTPVIGSLTLDWWLFFAPDSNGTPGFGFVWGNGAATSAVTSYGVAALDFLSSYYVAVLLSHNPGAPSTTATLIWRKLGAGAESSVGPTAGFLMSDRAYDVFAYGATTTGAVYESTYFGQNLQGIVQEARFWDVARSAPDRSTYYNQQLDAASIASGNLKSYFPLTGAGPSSWSDAKAGAQPFRIEPVYIRRGTAVVGSGYSAQLDGRNDGLQILDAYRYRNPVLDATSAAPMWANWFVAANVVIDKLVNHATIHHYAHCAVGSYVTCETAFADTGGNDTAGTHVGATERMQWVLELYDFGGGTGFQWRGVVYFDDGSYAVVRTNIGGGVLAGTTYRLLLWRQNSAAGATTQKVQLYLNGAALAGSGVTATNALATQNLYKTADSPTGSWVKYGMTAGRAMKRIRMGSSSEVDPNDVDFEIDFARSFPGRLDNLVVGKVESADVANIPYIANYLSLNQLDRSTVNSLAAGMLSCWNFDEPSGDICQDIGQLANPIFVVSDQDHLRDQSLITTTNKSPIDAVIEHRYQSPGVGEVKKLIAVHRGGIAEVDLAAGSVTHTVGGFRNDDGDIIQHTQFLNTEVIVSGSGKNAQLVAGDLYPLSIDPPSGVVPVGLTDQNGKYAKLTTGRYVYGWRFFSAITGSYSAIGIQQIVDILCEKANVLFGTSAEMSQVSAYAPTGPVTAGAIPGGTAESKPSYDLTTLNQSAYLRAQSWDSSTENGPEAGTPDPKFIVIKFATNPGGTFTPSPNLLDPENVTVEEIEDFINEYPGADRRFFVQRDPDDRWRIRSTFVGANARLKLRDAPGVGAGGALLNLFFGCGSGNHQLPDPATATNYYAGSGVTGHGIGIPVSSQRHVTHVELCRTNTDGTDLRVLLRVPNGTTELKDALDDALNTGEIVDITLTAPPPCKYVSVLDGQYLYFGDPDQPQRMYVSPRGFPWLISNSSTVDFRDGRSLALTGAGGTESRVTAFKDDVTFVLTPSDNPAFPFYVDVRLRDLGCCSPHGIAQQGQTLFYPEEQGFQVFDGSWPRYASDPIRTTWAAIPTTYRSLISAVSFSDDQCILWACPSGTTLIGGIPVNDTVLAYFYKQPGGYGWAKLTNLPARFFALVSDSNERDRVLFVDHHGFINQFDVGDSFGLGDSAAPLTAQTLTVSAGSVSSVTVPQATLANLPYGYLGLFMVLVKSDGTRQVRLVIADTLASPSVLTPDHNFSVAPVAGDTLFVCSVEAYWQSGDIVLTGETADEHVTKVHAIRVTQELQTPAASLTLLWQARGGLSAPGTSVSVPAFKSTTFSNGLDEDVFIEPQYGNNGVRHVLALDARGVGKKFHVQGFEQTFIISGDVATRKAN